MRKELFLALENDNLGEIQYLYGQDSRVINELTFHGDNVLHIAAREGLKNIVDWIHNDGSLESSSAKVQNNDQNTPLHEAARNGHADVVETLLQRYWSCGSERNKFGETPLTIACKYGHKDTVKKLLGADSRGTVTQETYEHGATSTNETHQSTSQTTYKEGALHAAVQRECLEIVEEMLKHSVWQDLMIEQDKFGRCAIHVAAINGRWDIIEKFISKRPDCVQIRSSDHKSVLHFAVECNQYKVVKLLLKDKNDSKIAEMVSRDHDNLHNTALHMATKNRVDPQLLDLLLSSPGVDVNACNIDGMTALDIASAGSQHNSHCPTIEWKLKHAGAMKHTRAMHARGEPNTIPDDNINTHMVVASLIAIVTFAAVFQIPGGIEEDDKTKAQYGAAKLALHKLFRLFVFSDTAAFITSLSVVVICLIKQRWQETHLRSLVPHELSNIFQVNLIISIFWTVVAFVTATILITVPRDLDKLKHHEAFTKYQSLWQNEIWLFVAVPYLIVVILFISGPRFAVEKSTLRGALGSLLYWVERTLRMPNLCKGAVKLSRDLGIFKIFLCQLSIMTAFILVMSFV